MHIVVLGGGPAGLAAATEALQAGHAVTVVDPGDPGGNALYHSLVPSKVLIERAAAGTPGGAFAWTGWMARQREVVAAVAAQARAELEGARLVRGTAHLVRQRGRVAAQVDGTALPADGIIVATGSQQVLVPGLAPDGSRVLLPRAFATLKAPPTALAVVGAGPTGLEAAALFARAGSRVSLFTPHARLLPDWAWEVSAGLQALFRHLGVDVFYGQRIERLEADGTLVRLHTAAGAVFTTPAVFLATGRRPTVPREEYADAGLAVDAAGFLATDAVGRTNVEGVFAAGDAAGMPLLANKARWQGRMAARTALGQVSDPIRPPAFVEAVYTHPDAARVGATPGRGLPRGAAVWLARPRSLTYRLALEALPDVPAVALVYADGPDGPVRGAEAFGPRAADLLAPVALAVAAGLPVSRLRDLPAATPTVAEWLADLVPVPSPQAPV
ncbi:MAG: FAD-dependent oxidoreductase [Actinomycetia bacterium]|nr:FAD-dependent oxidoreductase [Actinomycetes bacterium]